MNKIADILDTEKKWTKWDLARDVCGRRTWPQADQAVCWCLGGAIIKDAEVNPLMYRDVMSLAQEVIKDVTGRELSITSFNDTGCENFAQMRKVVEELDRRVAARVASDESK